MNERSTLQSRQHAPTAGDVIAHKYRLERCLGEGGQGCVWRAQNLVLELPVALKLVHHGALNPLLPERLFREARAAATLGHPSIVRVFDIGQTSEGSPFLVMELLRGESLADWLVRVGRLGPTQALRMLLPIADGLVAAHAQGIIHRDVKPDNIFVALSGETVQPKLLDFGLARRSKGRDRLKLTDAGVVLGTPAYLSPEQACGNGHIDERADVWSFCATLYECLAGVVPFQGTTWDELRRQILEDEPSTIRGFGVEDAKLWQHMRRGLAKSKVKRWNTMQALGRALACWLLERGVTSDICGVSLEARWLRSEPMALSLQAAQRSEVPLAREPAVLRALDVPREPTLPSEPARAREPAGRRAPTRRLRQSRTRRRFTSLLRPSAAIPAPTTRSRPPSAAPTSGSTRDSRAIPNRRRLLAGALGLVVVALATIVTVTHEPRAANVDTPKSAPPTADPTALSDAPEKPRAPAPVAQPRVDFAPTPEPDATPPARAVTPTPALAPRAGPTNSAASTRNETPLKLRTPLIATSPQAARRVPRDPAESLELMEPY